MKNMPDEIWVDTLTFMAKREPFRGHVKYTRATPEDKAPIAQGCDTETIQLKYGEYNCERCNYPHKVMLPAMSPVVRAAAQSGNVQTVTVDEIADVLYASSWVGGSLSNKEEARDCAKGLLSHYRIVKEQP